jgi:hypothetical protein
MNHWRTLCLSISLIFTLRNKSLREEAQWMLKDYRNLERNVGLACAGLQAWLFGQHWHEYHDLAFHRMAFCIPLVLAILGAIRAFGILTAFSILHLYLLKLEAFFSVDSPTVKGWEHFLDARTGGAEKLRKTGASKFAVGFWAILIFVNLAVAIAVIAFKLPST